MEEGLFKERMQERKQGMNIREKKRARVPMFTTGLGDGRWQNKGGPNSRTLTAQPLIQKGFLLLNTHTNSAATAHKAQQTDLWELLRRETVLNQLPANKLWWRKKTQVLVVSNYTASAHRWTGNYHLRCPSHLEFGVLEFHLRNKSHAALKAE